MESDALMWKDTDDGKETNPLNGDHPPDVQSASAANIHARSTRPGDEEEELIPKETNTTIMKMGTDSEPYHYDEKWHNRAYWLGVVSLV